MRVKYKWKSFHDSIVIYTFRGLRENRLYVRIDEINLFNVDYTLIEFPRDLTLLVHAEVRETRSLCVLFASRISTQRIRCNGPLRRLKIVKFI